MKKIFLVLAIAGISTLSFGQLDRSVRPKAGAAPELQIKDPQVFTLSNGLKVILSENHKLPTVAVYYNSPSELALEGEKAGTSKMMGELILAGTASRTKDQFDNEKDFIGLSIFSSAKQLYIQTLKKHLPKATDLFKDALFNASFPQSEIDRVKTKYDSDLLAGKSNPTFIGSNVMKKLMYGDKHPQGEILTEVTLKNITRDDIVAAYKRMYTPTEGYLTIVGDMTLAEAKKYAEDNFSSWKGVAPYAQKFDLPKSTQGNRVIFINKKGAVQSKIYVAFPLDIQKGDVNDLPFNVTNQILGGSGFGTRFMQNLREDKAYTYGAYSQYATNEYGSYFAASGDFRNAVTDSAITQFVYELTRITEGKVTADELAQTKAMMTGRFARSLQDAETYADFAYNIFKYNLPADYYKTYLQKLEAISEDDVLAISKKFINPKNLFIIVVGNEEVLDKLKQFDADGNIEKLDAYGDPVKDLRPADITKEQLIEKYILLNTNAKNIAEAKAKLKKIKSVEQTIEVSTPQIPMPLTMKQYFQAPNKSAMSIEVQGMMVQRQYFDGKTGGQFVMQQGNKDLTAEEISEKQKNTGLFDELNYATLGTNYELQGIENQNGVDYYVVYRKKEKSESYDYYTMDGQKSKTVTIATMKDDKDEEKTTEVTNTYADYKDVNGIKFPHKTNMIMGEMGMNGEVKEIKVNGKIDAKVFKK